MKFCRDCKHYAGDCTVTRRVVTGKLWWKRTEEWEQTIYQDECLAEVPNIITGEMRALRRDCLSARSPDGECGPEAKLFEDKQ